MEITVKGKKYTIEKLTRAKKKIYTEEFEKINKLSEKLKAGQVTDTSDDEQLGEMYEALVKLYDNQFTVEDLDEEDCIEMTFAFMSIRIEMEERLNSKIDNVKKTFQKSKKSKK